MKDNLFEMLLTLFEKTLSQLKENHEPTTVEEADDNQEMNAHTSLREGTYPSFVKSAGLHSTRIFTHDEQMKLTKASYQFLMRLASWDVLPPDLMELILNQIIFSESRFVSLQETKWTIRNTLASILNAEQLAFLDLVLYHKEDKLTLH